MAHVESAISKNIIITRVHNSTFLDSYFSTLKPKIPCKASFAVKTGHDYCSLKKINHGIPL
jgi:hypothetical protein